MALTARRLIPVLAIAGVAVAAFIRPASGQSSAPVQKPIRIGAVFPLTGDMDALARQEYLGVRIAANLVNKGGGVKGHRIAFLTRQLEYSSAAPAIMRGLHHQGITTVVGAYASGLSIPAAAAAAHQGLVYWETGAVADRLTGQGLKTVFRVGASGTNLGTNSARFAATQLAPRLHKRSSSLRISIVYANDAYAVSVANAARREAGTLGMPVVSWTRYDPYLPVWSPIISRIKKAHPDVLILASHIPDGVAFRRSMLAAHVHVGAMIGSTMAECGPDFGDMLGKDAVGVFASDRPLGSFNARAMLPGARSLYAQFAGEWHRRTGQAQPSEEGLTGFSAAWVLLHYVLPGAAAHGSLSPTAIAASARSLSLPSGTLPNGAGVLFARDRGHEGQNQRASAVVWQWQGVRHSVVVWPALYATGTVKLVPLPR